MDKSNAKGAIQESERIKGEDGDGFYGLAVIDSKPKIQNETENSQKNEDDENSQDWDEDNTDDQEAKNDAEIIKNKESENEKITNEEKPKSEITAEKDELSISGTINKHLSEMEKTKKENNENPENDEKQENEEGNNLSISGTLKRVKDKPENDENEALLIHKKFSETEMNDQNTIFAPEEGDNQSKKDEKTLFETAHDIIVPPTKEEQSHEDEEKTKKEENEQDQIVNDENEKRDASGGEEQSQIEEEPAPEPDDNDLHTDINNDNDTVKIYTGSEPPKTAPLTRKVSLTKLPPLATTPEQDAQNEALLKRYIKYGKLPDISLREGLIQYLQRQKINSLVQNDYVAAAKTQDLVSKLMIEMNSKDEQERKQILYQNAEEKLEQLNRDIAEANRSLRRALKDEEYKQKERKRQLLSQHEHELDDFEEHWNDQEFLRITFARPSSTLLQLKATERQLIITKMFDRAEEIKKKCQELEVQESEEAQRNAFREMEKAQKKIESRHKVELEVFEQHYQKNMNEIQRNHDIKMQAMEARRVKLEKEIDEFKHPNTMQLPKIVATPDNVETVMTARTAQRYSTYKSSMKSPKITIKPLGKIKRHKINLG